MNPLNLFMGSCQLLKNNDYDILTFLLKEFNMEKIIYENKINILYDKTIYFTLFIISLIGFIYLSMNILKEYIYISLFSVFCSFVVVIFFGYLSLNIFKRKGYWYIKVTNKSIEYNSPIDSQKNFHLAYEDIDKITVYPSSMNESSSVSFNIKIIKDNDIYDIPSGFFKAFNDKKIIDAIQSNYKISII